MSSFLVGTIAGKVGFTFGTKKGGSDGRYDNGVKIMKDDYNYGMRHVDMWSVSLTGFDVYND